MKYSSVCLFILGAGLFVSQEAFAVEVGVGLGINKPVKNFRQIKNRNIIGQSLDFSCGPASLATLMSYYFKDKITEEQIIKSLILTTDLEKIKRKKGFSLLDLKNFARMRGYDVVGYRMDMEYLRSLDQPILVPINLKDYAHFVIVRGVQDDRVFIADPALGNLTLKIDKFLVLWQGIGLVLTKSGKGDFNSPLKLTKEEKAVFADPEMVRRILSGYEFGKIYADGEF